jgi:beta-lactamase class A
LIDLVGVAAVNDTLKSLGLAETRLRRRMMDMVAASRGDENVSTPAEAARIMELLFRGEFISRAVSEDILSILKIPKSSAVSSALPAGTVVAGKPGNISGVSTEWAVVMLKNRPYIIVVMENYGLESEASGAIKEISKLLHEYFQRLSRATPHGVYLPTPTT